MHTNNASLEAFSLCNQTEGASYATVRYCRGGIGSPFQPDFIGTEPPRVSWRVFYL